MDLLWKCSPFVRVMHNKVLSRSLLFRASTYQCFGKQEEVALVRKRELWAFNSSMDTQESVYVLSCSVGVGFHPCFSWPDILCRWVWAMLLILCREWKRDCAAEHGSAYTIWRGLQWGNSCWVTVSNTELASQLLLQCLSINFLIFVENIQ